MRIRYITPLVIAVALTGCSSHSNAQPSGTANPSVSSSPVITIPPNVIDKNAAVEYRTAIETSLTAATAAGLTETWKASDGTVTQLVVFDPVSGRTVEFDAVNSVGDDLDVGAIMPNMLMAELDGLESNSGTDTGAVASPAAGTFVITNHIDGAEYVSTYVVDSQKRIISAHLVVDGEVAGDNTYEYTVTSAGAAALASTN